MADLPEGQRPSAHQVAQPETFRQKLTEMNNSRHRLILVSSIALLFMCGGSPIFAQSEQNSAPGAQTKVNVDPSKYALLISGASGEPAYAKQFQQWTAALRGELWGRFGFAKDHVK